MTKQYYVKDKIYKWTKETASARKKGPVYDTSTNGCVKFESIYGLQYYPHMKLTWGCNFGAFSLKEDGVEIPEELIPFYGKEGEQEWDGEGIPPKGVKFQYCFVGYDRWWNAESRYSIASGVVAYCEAGCEQWLSAGTTMFRKIPLKSFEETLAEKYNVSLETINQMIEDGVIEKEEV